MLLPQYFRVRPSQPAYNRSHVSGWMEREQVSSLYDDLTYHEFFIVVLDY